MRPWAVYVHVPFCVRRCSYCDFATEALRPGPAAEQERVRAYLTGLHAELAAAPLRPASSVYVGGGTPTTLPAAELLRILGHLRDHGGVMDAAEITVEANPTTAEADLFGALREGGFNRLSMGVQTFDDALLTRLHRAHTAAEALRAYDLARSAGFDNVSIDLIFALPEQTLAAWASDLERALALEPEHISLYNLTIEEGTPLARQVARGVVTPADDSLEADMYQAALDLLGAAGYEHYEISNFARPGRRSRHNQVYWRNEEYRGFGPGAASYCARRRWTNVAAPLDYARRALAGEDLAAEAEERDLEGERRETMYLALRMMDGVDAGWFARRYGQRPEEWFGGELSRLVARGLLEAAGDAWRLTRQGLFLANQVFLEFV